MSDCDRALEVSIEFIEPKEQVPRFLADHSLRDEIVKRIGDGGPDGEDLFQDVALVCLTKAERYKWSKPLIIRIAKRLWVDHVRRERRRKDVHSLIDDFHPDPETVDQAPELPDCRSLDVIDDLPPSDQDIIYQRIFKGKRYTEIAYPSGDRPGKIRLRFHRAIQLCRRMIESRVRQS